MGKIKEKLKSIDNLKFPIITLIIGLTLMLIPISKTDNDVDADSKLRSVLSCTEGVGEVSVIVSEHGVVVVCQGADDASVRLNIISAIKAYTGFTSGDISILCMSK